MNPPVLRTSTSDPRFADRNLHPDAHISVGAHRLSSLVHRHPQWVLGLALVLALALGALRLHPFTAAYGDEALYLMLGQSLRFEGRYAEIGMAGQPPESEYPPGFPMMIAGVMALAGTGQRLVSAIFPVKIAVLFLYLISLVLLFNLLARHGPIWVALATVMALAVHPLVGDLATQPMTDVPFLAAAIATLWLIDRATQARPDGRTARLWAALAGVMAAFTTLIRLPGVVLIASGVVAFVAMAWQSSGRRWRLARPGLILTAIFVLAAGISMLPWFWHISRLGPRAQSEGDTVESLVANVASVDLYQVTAPSATPRELAARLAANTQAAISGLSSHILNQPWRRLPGDLFGAWTGKLDFGFGLLLGALMALGVVVGVRHRQGSLVVFVIGMQAILLLWPYPQPRYALPLIPFYFFYLFLGLDWLLRQAGPVRLPSVGIGLFATAIIVTLFLASFDAGWHTQARRRAADVTAFHAATSAEWANFFQATAWTAAHSTPDAVIMSRKPTLTYLFGERPAVSFVWSHDAGEWMTSLSANHVGFIVEDAFTWSDVTDRFLRPILTIYPNRFHLVYETPPPVTRVWRVG